MIAFVLGSIKVDCIIKKWNGKWNTIYLNSFWYLKMIFILLTKIIVIYIRFLQVDF